jgi:hypothetical protein
MSDGSPLSVEYSISNQLRRGKNLKAISLQTLPPSSRLSSREMEVGLRSLTHIISTFRLTHASRLKKQLSTDYAFPLAIGIETRRAHI